MNSAISFSISLVLSAAIAVIIIGIEAINFFAESRDHTNDARTRFLARALFWEHAAKIALLGTISPLFLITSIQGHPFIFGLRAIWIVGVIQLLLVITILVRFIAALRNRWRQS